MLFSGHHIVFSSSLIIFFSEHSSFNILIRPRINFFNGAWNTLGPSAIYHKGDNFCAFLFPFMHAKTLLKSSLLLKERICFQWEQILSFESRPLFQKECRKKIEKMASLLTECMHFLLSIDTPGSIAQPWRVPLRRHAWFQSTDMPGSIAQTWRFQKRRHAGFHSAVP